MKRQIAALYLCGAFFTFFCLAVLFAVDDWTLALPLAVIDAWFFFAAISRTVIFRRGTYIKAVGVCVQIERAKLFKRIKSIRVQTEKGMLRVMTRQRLRRLQNGDTVVVFLSKRERLYEQNGEYIVCGYYAIEHEKTSQTQG